MIERTFGVTTRIVDGAQPTPSGINKLASLISKPGHVIMCHKDGCTRFSQVLSEGVQVGMLAPRGAMTLPQDQGCGPPVLPRNLGANRHAAVSDDNSLPCKSYSPDGDVTMGISLNNIPRQTWCDDLLPQENKKAATNYILRTLQ